MLDLRLVRPRATLAITLLAAMATGSPTGARDDEQARPETVPDRVDRADATWAFGVKRADAQTSLETRLTLEVDRLERSCRLDEAQKKKLQLAGRGDIKRLLDRVDAAARPPRAVPGGQMPEDARQREMESLHRQYRFELPLQGSMFAKTMAKALREDQMASYRAASRESRRFRHRALVDLVVDVLDVAAGCSDDQRQRLTKLLLEETRLPTKADGEFFVVLAQASRLSESRLRPLFDDPQWRVLSRMLKELDAGLKAQLDEAVFDPDDDAGPVASRPSPTTSVKD